MGYISWGQGRMKWPPTEESVYTYMKECAGTGSPPSRASRLMEAMGFIKGSFEFKVDDVLSSKRLK
eukprot:12257799-Karenia_brevis.AAC.1